ncbi:TspO/MBR family protein [Pseudalkalibacillus berkeleyi]|uniref:Tryptophan-rich sensory protein n=1 Tax=Pseudalkalibacillus berkeleyi TaxID=1069813 RepID=A0ABS9GYG0_9BACL|nr:TspO/MBR family protein [Pseudalkalibacillus berkeleyi]MCF6136725.1 tryptophan-rich sensory protein [Pseudalkalibacillus berkeleyi]
MNKKVIVLYMLSVLSYILMVGINAYANILPLNGQTTGEISDRFNVLFTPAGYVFSIWSVIYVLLAVWLIYLLFPKSVNHNVFQKTGIWFVVSSLLNAAWIVLWHYEYFNWTLVVMVGLLLSLIILYSFIQRSSGKRLLDRLPFSIYLGWVSVATIVNTGVVLEHNQWKGWGLSDVSWTLVLLFAGTMLAIVFSWKNDDLAFPLVFIWAYIGIAVKQQEYPSIQYTAIGMAVVIGALFIYTLNVRRRNKLL